MWGLPDKMSNSAELLERMDTGLSARQRNASYCSGKWTIPFNGWPRRRGQDQAKLSCLLEDAEWEHTSAVMPTKYEKKAKRMKGIMHERFAAYGRGDCFDDELPIVVYVPMGQWDG